MADKKSPYNANFWSFLREKALSYHENSKCPQNSEELKEIKNVEKITNLIKDCDAA